MITTCSVESVPHSCFRFFRKVTSSFFRSLADRESEIFVANAVLLMEITSSVDQIFGRSGSWAGWIHDTATEPSAVAPGHMQDTRPQGSFDPALPRSVP